MAVTPRRRRARWVRWLIAVAVVIVVAGVAGPYVYIHLLSRKAPRMADADRGLALAEQHLLDPVLGRG